MIIKLYQTGVTTREISDIIERMYGHYYSPATVSNIFKVTQETVSAFHERQIKPHYSILYLGGTILLIASDYQIVVEFGCKAERL